MKRSANRSSSAFTLIELLVVIAIIAVLAALLFTALAGSRQKSNQTVSLNNLKQWASALESSLADFDGRLPSDGMKGDKLQLDDLDAWFNRLPPYLNLRPLNDEEMKRKPPKFGERSVWVNPAVPESLFVKLNDPPSKFLFSYAMNDYLSPDSAGSEVGAERTLPKTRIESHASTVFMVEQGAEEPGARPKTMNAFFGGGDPKASPDNLAHILFCDGHIELVPRSKWDPEKMDKKSDNPSTEDDQRINPHISFIPFKGAKP